MMGYNYILLLFSRKSYFLCVTFLILMSFCSAQMDSPAMYVFGDSLVDVGNNNHLKLSLVKANHPHYGIDFPTKKANGRFSDGKNPADFLAEKLGLASPPPYLSLVTEGNKSYLQGVSFASGGAGIFDGTDQRYRQSIPLSKQVDHFAQVHEEMTKQVGDLDLQKHISNSIFIVVIGSNDLFDYLDSLSRTSTPSEFVNSMASSLKVQLKRLYDYGGRKFEVVGVAAIGCCPVYRVRNGMECDAEANYWAFKYNEGLKAMLKEWTSENDGISYSYFDTYALLNHIIHNPSIYGFTEVKAACCGLGELNALAPCLPVSKYCWDREDYVFWDQYHPTEAASRIFADRIFDGSANYTSPINMRQLLTV